MKEFVQCHIARRLVRISYIGFASAAYFVAAACAAYILEACIGNFDIEVESKKSTVRLCVELVLHMWIVGIVIYEVRMLVEAIPFMEGMFGFQRKHIAAVTTGSVFVVMFIGFQRYLGRKLEYVYNERIAKN